MILSATAAFYLTCAGLVVGAVTDDPFGGGADVRTFSFEKDERGNEYFGEPHDWTRRKGTKFPHYIEIKIDRDTGRHEHDQPVGQSLRIEANGGQAIAYSPTLPVDPLHSYVFEGHIRTQQLKHSAAIISVSFLNHQRHRIQRLLTRPVTGTHADWQAVRVGPISPHRDASFVVIGCHLVHGSKMDIRGRAWFDDLWIGMLPQMSLVSNFHRHFVQREANILIESTVTGLDAQREYELRFEVRNSSDEVVAETSRPVEPLVAPISADDGEQQRAPEPEKWEVTPKPHGYYRVTSTLLSGDEVMLEKETSFVVLDLSPKEKTTGRGEFGWTFPNGTGSIDPKHLADVAKEGGVNWIKHPVWQSVYSDDLEIPARISQLFDEMIQKGVTPVGVLSDPPRALRDQFAKDWSGISEIFSMPPAFWSRSLESVIARYSSTVRYWQLGSDTDASFVGINSLPTTLANVKREFDRIGRDTRIGLHWEWDRPFPPSHRALQTFFSLHSKRDVRGEELVRKLRASEQNGLRRWVVIERRSDDMGGEDTPETRGADLVKQMVSARIGGANVIFAGDVVDAEYGLMNSNGSPTPLFLPWRTTAMALKGAQYLGALDLAGLSTNHAFVRGQEVMLIIWNDLPDVSNENPAIEELYLGENVTITDVWGRQQKASVVTDDNITRQQIRVGHLPLVVRGGSAPIARWRMVVRFRNATLKSQHGNQDLQILIKNTFPEGVSGTAKLNVPSEWDVERREWDDIALGPGEETVLPTTVSLPPNVSLGDVPVSIDFDLVADRKYTFRVRRTLKVGQDDILIHVIERFREDGGLEIEQVITNNTSPTEILNFRCSLLVPEHRRQKVRVTKLGNGIDRKIYFLPNVDQILGKRVRLRIEEVDGQRNLNYSWHLGENEE